MSFTSEVKSELVRIIPEPRHCQIAEIAAFVHMSTFGRSAQSAAAPGPSQSAHLHPAQPAPLLRTDDPAAATLLFTLLQRAFNIDTVVADESRRGRSGRAIRTLTIADPAMGEKVRKAAFHSAALRMTCCKRAFLRGAFLIGGSVSSPEKSYHLEITTPFENAATLIRSTMVSLNLDAKIVLRKKEFVVYLKEADQITDFLGAVGANISFLNIENVRVLKEISGNINRRVNFETANLNKTIVTALRQIEDIEYIRDTRGFGNLSPALREMAEIRLAYPDASLTELGNMLEPRIGKSGVNHRLRKLSSCAAELRRKSGEEDPDADAFHRNAGDVKPDAASITEEGNL